MPKLAQLFSGNLKTSGSSVQSQRVDHSARQSIAHRYLAGWGVTAIIIGIDWAWMSLRGYAVPNEFVFGIGHCALALLFLAAVLTIFSKISRYALMTGRFRFREVSDTLSWVALLACFFAACNLLQYLCTTVGAPLVDGILVQIDCALGFEWVELYRWVRARPAVQHVFKLAYVSFFLQLLLVPVVLGLSRRRAALSEFVTLLMISQILLLFLSTALPASSAFVHFGISDPGTSETVSDFSLLRNGVLTLMNPVQGLVSMPSFHTMVAIVCTYSLRGMPVAFAGAAALNTLMIASTPTQGGHYLVDVLAGILCAIGTIWSVRRLFARRSTLTMSAIVMAPASASEAV